MAAARITETTVQTATWLALACATLLLAAPTLAAADDWRDVDSESREAVTDWRDAEPETVERRWSPRQWRADDGQIRGHRPNPRLQQLEPRRHPRVQSGYPNTVTREWVPGHFVGGYMYEGKYVPRRWVPGQMAPVLAVD